MRRQLPVHSSISWSAVSRGFAAATLGDKDGRIHGRLAEALRARYGAEEVLLTDSGTSALALGIAGAVGESGQPVALPGYSCYDVATAAVGAGARVLLYDVDPLTLGPDWASVRSMGSAGPAAIVVCHLFGHLVDVPEACVALGGDAVVIEDAAQGVGGSLHGRPLGSFGSLSILSFGRGKGITGGGGGALLAHDERGLEAFDWIRRHRVPGHGGRGFAKLLGLVGQLVLGRPSLYGLPSALPFLHLGETRYHPPSPARGAALSSVAVVEGVLPLAELDAQTRLRNAERLLGQLARSRKLRAPEPVSGGQPGFLRLPVLATSSSEGVLDASASRLGAIQGYPTTLAVLPSLAPLLLERGPSLPGSSRLARSLLTLPTHGLLSEADLLELGRWIVRD